MSSWQDKQEALFGATPESKPNMRARATLKQLRHSGGFGVSELSPVNGVPQRVIRHSIEDTVWVLVSKPGEKPVYECRGRAEE